MELDKWIEKQARLSANLMEDAISATNLRREREAFEQIVVPARGSVLASPRTADWNPEPDYFFHWVRDSAIVMRTVVELAADAQHDELEHGRWTRHFEDYVTFSLALTRIEPQACVSPAERTKPRFREFLRPESELRGLTADDLLGEPRFNADGSLDILRWSRPQYDGPALRALACLAFLGGGGTASEDIHTLVRRDLDFTVRHAGAACIGPWEEEGENAHHYYVALVQLAALLRGRRFVAAPGAEARLRSILDGHWSPEHQIYAAIWPFGAGGRDELIDAACLLAVLDGDLPGGPHSIDDPRVWKTLTALEDLFAREFLINRGRAAPALGRSRRDHYFGGGAWYVTTLAAASLCYRRAARSRDRALIARGDVFMTTVQDLTPADGHLSEQVDRTTGRPASARDLTWSYAAFVSAARLRSIAYAALSDC